MGQTNPHTMIEAAKPIRAACARRAIAAGALTAVLALSTLTGLASAATYRSANFLVTASSPSVARELAEVAEEYRRTFASEWLQVDLPDWDSPCTIWVEEEPTGGQGWVSYQMFRGKTRNLRIRVQGRLEHIVEYVLPHEVAHAVLARSIAHPLPRWADEGVALLCESESQQARQRQRAVQLVEADAIMSLSEMLALVDYPDERQQVIGFYTACYSLTEYLVARGGKQRLLNFVNDGNLVGWDKSVRRHYGTELLDLESGWKSWVSEVDRAPTDLATSVAMAPLADAVEPAP